jgi:hypothetical protein
LKEPIFRTLHWKLIKPWLGVIGLAGLGLLPCPDCGAPMIFHFWPIALVLTLRNLIKHKAQQSIAISSNCEDSFCLQKGLNKPHGVEHPTKS